MITEQRLKELMAQCGMPESHSVMRVLQQCDMEAELRSRDRINSLVADLAECDEITAALEEQINEYRFAVGVNERAIGAIFAANQSLDENNERLREDVRKLMTANSLLIGDNKTAIKNVAEFQHELSMREAAHSRLDEEMQRVCRHNQILRDENRELRMTLDAAKFATAGVVERFDALKSLLASMMYPSDKVKGATNGCSTVSSKDW